MSGTGWHMSVLLQTGGVIIGSCFPVMLGGLSTGDSACAGIYTRKAVESVYDFCIVR